MQTSPVYTDFQSLAALRGVEGLGEAERLENVAGQFASVFTHMMLKSMRAASLGEGILDSQQSVFYRDMFDQQLALSLSESGGVGIAGMLSDYLRNVTGVPEPESAGTNTRPDNGRRALAAYAGVSNMNGGNVSGASQDAAAAADTGDSRNELQGDAVNPVTLRWRGQTPRQ